MEILLGIIIIFIGNAHYNTSWKMTDICTSPMHCLGYRRHGMKQNGTYLSVRARTASSDPHRAHALLTSAQDLEESEVSGCCDWTVREPRMDTIIDIEKADSNIEIAKIKAADADVKIVRGKNYIKVVEDALKKSPGNQDLEEELGKAREELNVASRERDEAEAEQKLSEAQQHHAFYVKEQWEDHEERVVFNKGTFWQHSATYLLYLIGIMNIFITTFGISGGHANPIINVNATPDPT